MRPVEQPVGLVTLVFTDIEGSTRLLRQLGEESYRHELSVQRGRVRTAFGRHGGYEVGVEGDGFFYAFASAEAAAHAVGDAMMELEGGPIRIRVGIHSGTPGLDPPDYFGLDVHKAARVMAAGHGGQVLVSQATRELLGDRLAVRYLGEYRLKDIELPEPLYQLGEGQFPPLRTLYHTNLPMPASPFVGREQELGEVVGLIQSGVSLVTLAGPGGSGKTRLAVQAASALSEEFPDGVWWLPLAELRDPALILPELARVLGLKDSEGGIAEQLGEVLAGKHLLLLLDNAEHLLPAAATALAFLRDLAGPALLVTSRERLHLSGEQVYPVPPLSSADGYRLFELRARAIEPSFEAGPAVGELCSRLDELPLAIELAAAQTTTLLPEQILRRLSHRLDLGSAGRDVDPRQRTLRATIEWSHALLDDTERELFARLAVFAGGCTLETVEEVCGASLETLAALVDKSLIRRSGERFWLLETIREYAAEQLDATGELEQLQRRHADFYLCFAAKARQGIRGSSVASWLDRLEQELPNMRGALAFLLGNGDAAGALELATRLRLFWQARSASEGLGWLDQALATEAGTPYQRGEGFLAAAGLAGLHGGTERKLTLVREAIEAAGRAGDEATLAMALGQYAWTLAEQGDEHGAIEMMQRTRELAPVLSDPHARVEALRYVAMTLSMTGNLDEAARLNRDVLQADRDLGYEMHVAYVLNAAGYKALLAGEFGEAIAALEESLEIARRLRLSLVRIVLGNLGLVSLFQGRYREAITLLGEQLQLAVATGDRRTGAEAVLGLAAANAALGDHELAVTLEAIAKAENEATGIVEAAEILDRLEPHLRTAREIRDERLEALTRRGRPLNLQTAVAVLASHFTQHR